jgi:HEAT repeat protein
LNDSLPQVLWNIGEKMSKKIPFVDDKRTTMDLVKTAISFFPSDTAWIAITILQHRGSQEEFNAAKPLLNSSEPTEREVAVNIIGQLGWEKVAFQQETVGLLIDRLHDQSVSVIAAAATALGYRHDAKSLPYLLELKQHPSPDVRLGVVLGLSQYNKEEAAIGLIELSQDPDNDVRNWATFGLASQLTIDTPALREALFMRLEDNNSEIRGEALIGLAKRKDERATASIIRALNSPFDGIWPVEAAEWFTNPIFYPHLISLRKRIKGSVETRFIKAIDNAIRACKPS